MKKKSPQLQKLHCLNSFIAAATGSKMDIFQNLQQTINFIIRENPSVDIPNGESRLIALTERFLELHAITQDSFAIAHCDLKDLEFPGILGIRLRLIRSIKQISGSAQAILIVTGLKERFLPKANYFSKKAFGHYSECLHYLQQFIADRVAPSTALNILFF